MSDLKSRKQIGKKLRKIRSALGLTQAQMAKKYNETPPISLKVTRGDISKYELGINVIPSDKYVKYLGLSAV